jgi:CheY-like chemotaxis protein
MSARKILIVDDDAELLETAAELLRQGGFDVATYSGHFNRLGVVAAERPDLVLLDVNMPFVPGDELYSLPEGDLGPQPRAGGRGWSQGTGSTQYGLSGQR